MKFKVIAVFFGLALVAGLAVRTLSVAPASVSADSGKRDVEVTFTKWVTTFPTLVGVVGGDAGSGPFAGEVLSRDPTVGGGRITQLEAIYSFKTGEHSLTAQVHVTQDNKQGSAVVIGVVTSGWMEGALVYGEYTVTTCSQNPAPGQVCFQGKLRIMPGRSD